MRLAIISIFAATALLACQTSDTFNPKSQYPPDPWVKGYSNPDDCLGGEKLAAIDFALPDYPRRAFNSGRQGWVIVRLDVDATGNTENVTVERAIPDALFPGNARDAVQKWRFEPPKDGPLQNCRVLIRYKFGRVSLGA
ncbi:energy transducer TonB [Fretibacter rubidus]|uniref:energy transducer TonB n=1 Tax=Fretibacter rubidus TaxID=570162 RepID=UPI00352A750D